MTSVPVDKPWSELDDFLGELATNDPATFYKRLRDSDPVHFNPRWGGWVLTRYDDVTNGFRDFQRLSSDRMAGPWGKESNRGGGDDRSVSQLYYYIGKFFAWMDPPDHSRFRTLLSSVFTPKSVEQLRPRIERLVAELLAELPVGERFDFVERFAFHLPVIVISEYLGTPPEARGEIRHWSEELSHAIFVRGQGGVPATNRAARGEQAIASFADFFAEVIADRRAAPRDDLISRMVAVRNGADALTDDEIIAQCILMIFAGHETTANLLANGVVAFHRNPDQWELLRSQPELARSATEEILRYDGPVAAQGRWARTTFELRDRTIEQGDRVMLVQYAANRDPEAFPDPDRFDIIRHPNKHVGLGTGIHTCLGAQLARIEIQEALRLLRQQFGAVEVLSDPLRYQSTLTSRSLEQLEVQLVAG